MHVDLRVGFQDGLVIAGPCSVERIQIFSQQDEYRQPDVVAYPGVLTESQCYRIQQVLRPWCAVHRTHSNIVTIFDIRFKASFLFDLPCPAIVSPGEILIIAASGSLYKVNAKLSSEAFAALRSQACLRATCT